MNIYPVILAGGSGVRLWPLSSPAKPKPFLDLFEGRTLFQATVERVLARYPGRRIRVVCGQVHRELVRRALEAAGVEADGKILVEPEGRNTGPAVLYAARHLLASDPEAVMAVLPADHLIAHEAVFHRALDAAATTARDGWIVLFGVLPTRPETGYGYIESEGTSQPLRPMAVKRFVEKPDEATARAYLEAGNFYWNSGMFVFSARTIAAEFAAFDPEMCARVDEFLAGNESAYGACPARSLDVAVLERSRKTRVIPVDLGWSDVGNWDAVHEQTARDEADNATSGPVHLESCRNTYLRASDRTLVGIGLADLIVVDTPGQVLIAAKGCGQKLKAVARDLERKDPEPRVEHRPWGSFTILNSGPGFKTKRLDILPGGRTSLQKHNHRDEHWVVVGGQLTATKGERTLVLEAGESITIPVGTVHRLENAGQELLSIIEVQTGPVLAEDDIVRFADDYGRIPDGDPA